MIVAIDAGSRDTAAAEHLLYEVFGRPESVVAATHQVRGSLTGDGCPHVALSISGLKPADLATLDLGHHVGSAILRPGAAEPEVAGPSKLVPGAYVAAVETALGTAGRLIRFPGQDQARGVLSAAELRRRCGIDRLEAIGGIEVGDDTLIDTLGFIRPIRRDGETVLQLQPAAGGLLIPFELEHQHACCADH